MLRRLALAVALLVALVAVGRAQQPQSAQAPSDLNADAVVAKSVAAQGGADKLKAVQSMRMTGTMMLPGVGDAPVTILAKRPKKVRVDIEIQGTQNSQGYDGETGWLFLPVQGMKAAQPAPPEMLKDLDDQADMDGPLVDYKAKGSTVELMGKEPVQGADAYKLKVTTKAGDIRYVYVDTVHFLPIKSESTRTINGAPSKATTVLGDYKAVAGVMMPYSIESTIEGVPVAQKLTLKNIEVNVPIEDTSFKMPAAKQ